jgi:hypothetical protein
LTIGNLNKGVKVGGVRSKSKGWHERSTIDKEESQYEFVNLVVRTDKSIATTSVVTLRIIEQSQVLLRSLCSNFKESLENNSLF